MKKRGCLFRIGRALAVMTLGFLALLWGAWVLPFWGIPLNSSRHGAPPITPPWALECWLWEDDVNTSEAVLELLKGYEENDFPVRTVLIDSPWSTRYNDFIVDEKRYPNPKEFFTGLQDRGYRVVLWMTCMVNSENDDTEIRDSKDWFEEAHSKGYLADGDNQLGWWKGRGGFIDYTNPEATKWWHGLQQNVFDWGIDGWKLDDTATYFGTRFGGFPLPYRRTFEGWMSTRSYMDHYYRDEYQHALTQNPEFITLARSADRWGIFDKDVTPTATQRRLDTLTHPEGFAPIDASTVNWVGDQDHEWELQKEGIEEALTDILRSASKGYNVIGSDVAGYSGGEIPPNLYIRWTQFSTFCGLFLNGGHGERAMWKRTPQELEIVRKFSWLHTELVPYMYSIVRACHEGGLPLMRPVEGTYQYMFGDALLIAPIYHDSLTREVILPPGKWRYFFDDREAIDGGKTITRDFPLEEFPVYVREGAILPLNVSRAYTGLGDKDSEGFMTFAVYPAAANSFVVRNHGSEDSTRIEVTARGDIVLSGFHVPHILRIKSETKPSAVVLDGTALHETDRWSYDSEKKYLVIRTREYGQGAYQIKYE